MGGWVGWQNAFSTSSVTSCTQTGGSHDSDLKIERHPHRRLRCNAGIDICLGPKAYSKPKEPLTISVIDVAGDLQVSQPAIENFRKAFIRSSCPGFVFTKATASGTRGLSSRRSRTPAVSTSTSF